MDDNCGKSNQTIYFFCMMLPVVVVLCMPGQYRVFPPPAEIIATRHCGMRATRHCRRLKEFLPIYPAWRSSPSFWGRLFIMVIARHNSSQLFSKGLQSGDFMGCSILVRLPCWRKSTTRLPDHGQVWRYHFGNGNYPRNAAWQMALRCFSQNATLELTGEVSVGEHKGDLTQQLKAPHTCTKPLPAWTL